MKKEVKRKSLYKNICIYFIFKIVFNLRYIWENCFFDVYDIIYIFIVDEFWIIYMYVFVDLCFFGYECYMFCYELLKRIIIICI